MDEDRMRVEGFTEKIWRAGGFPGSADLLIGIRANPL